MRDDGERDTPAVDRQLQLAGERRGIAGPPYGCPFLERRDLRQVECVADEDAVTREIDRREVIDGEVAERMGRGSSGCEQRSRRRDDGDEEERQSLHKTTCRAIGANRTEKFGFNPSAFAYQAFMPALSPAHPAA